MKYILLHLLLFCHSSNNNNNNNNTKDGQLTEMFVGWLTLMMQKEKVLPTVQPSLVLRHRQPRNATASIFDFFFF